MSASLRATRGMIEKIAVNPPPWAMPPMMDQSTKASGAASSPIGRVTQHRAMTAVAIHSFVRAASSGTPNAPTTAAIWKRDAVAPEDAGASPRVSDSSSGSHAVVA